jgi:CheY-like chemotaxis protein
MYSRYPGSRDIRFAQATIRERQRGVELEVGKQAGGPQGACIACVMPAGIHVLLVDNDEDLRGLATFLLESQGHSVAQARDGHAALEALRVGPRAGLIILDVEMPGMDGRTFLAHKALGAHATTPVVIFSSMPCPDLDGIGDVIGVVSKSDGIQGLLAVIPCVDAEAPLFLPPAGRLQL